MSAQQMRASVGEVWERCVVRVTVAQVLITGALIYIFDAWFTALHTSAFWSGPVDWTAHIGTALLVLNLLPWHWRRAILLPALLGSFLIDLDHIPEFLGDDFLTRGTPRPYTHSLTTPVVLCLLAGVIGLFRPRVRVLLVGFAFGVCLHFVRDLAESPGVGIPLLWPETKHAYGYPHWAYLVLIAVLIAANLLRLAARYPRGRAALSGPHRTRAAGVRLPDREEVHDPGPVPAQHQRAEAGRESVDQPPSGPPAR